MPVLSRYNGNYSTDPHPTDYKHPKDYIDFAHSLSLQEQQVRLCYLTYYEDTCNTSHHTFLDSNNRNNSHPVVCSPNNQK